MKRYLLFSLFFLLGAAVLAACTFPWERTANLRAVVSDVNRYSSRESKSFAVKVGSSHKLIKGDGVNVDQKGTANLEMGGCTLRIYRSSGLQVTGLPSSSAPVCTVYFQQGTIYNRVSKKMIINTDWMVIETVGTEFLAHINPVSGIAWVLVVENDVVVTAEGESVLVGAGETTWVWRGQPPEQPREAFRQEVAELIPPLEELTNGELTDDDYLPILVTGPEDEPPPEEPVEDSPPELKFAIDPQEIYTDEPFFVIASADDDNGIRLIEILINDELLKQCFEPFCELEWSFPEQGKRVVEARVFDTAEQMTSERAVLTVYPREVDEEPPKIYELAIITDVEEIIVGECPGPESMNITAQLPEEVLADRAILRYQWEGIEVQSLELERVDDFTFAGFLGGFEYCCAKTFIELLVQAYDVEGVLVAEGWRNVLMTYCIG